MISFVSALLLVLLGYSLTRIIGSRLSTTGRMHGFYIAILAFSWFTFSSGVLLALHLLIDGEW